MKPILFSTKMVKDILEGRKKQTRRVIKLKNLDLDEYYYDGTSDIDGYEVHFLQFKSEEDSPFAAYSLGVCPYGKIGDELWVRESFAPIINPKGESAFVYKADDDFYKDTIEDWKGWNSPVSMPKDAARIYLKITNISVERSKEVFVDDAKEKGSWYGNPFVWVIEFERCEKSTTLNLLK